MHAPAVARAQAWPAKPVRITVAYPPGGVADGMARLLADKLAPMLGQSVVVDNKAGASGTIGLDAVAKSAPDGHALGFAAISPLVLNPHLGKSPFDPARDIAPVASVIASPVLLLGTTALAAADFKALLAAAKARPGALRWATSGPASLGHIVLEQVKVGAGVDITHIPYKGGGQQINDALSAQFEVLSVNAGPAVMGHIQAGKLRPLAVGSPVRLGAHMVDGACPPTNRFAAGEVLDALGWLPEDLNGWARCPARPRWPSWACRRPTWPRCSACSLRPARRPPWSSA